MSDQVRKPFLTEDEQRARVRVAALALEADLVAREDEDGVEEQLADVRKVLDRVGREPSYTEIVEVKQAADRRRREQA